jgi:hypothetical protein
VFTGATPQSSVLRLGASDVQSVSHQGIDGGWRVGIKVSVIG